MKVDKVNVPKSLDDSYRHRKTFFSDREEAFLFASALKPKEPHTRIWRKRWGFGTHLNYFGLQSSLGASAGRGLQARLEQAAPATRPFPEALQELTLMLTSTDSATA